MIGNLKICCTHKHSVLEISNTLQALGWTHLVHCAPIGMEKRLLFKVGEGPVKVFIANGLRSIRPRKGMIIVVDAATALTHANIPMIPTDRTLMVALQGLPQLWRTDLVIEKPKVMDYVNMAVKPSFLTTVQTALYKVTNHAVRKAAQQAIIAYLNGKKSRANLMAVLKASYATEDLVHIMKQDEAQGLKAAVASYRAGEDVKAIERRTKCASFDILYLTRSFDKSNAPPPVPKPKKQRSPK